MIIRNNVVELLEREKQFTYSGIFFDGKLICLTKARVYLQKGRALSELVSQNYYFLTRGVSLDPSLNYTHGRAKQKEMVKDAIRELMNEGRLEIKQI